MRHAPAPSKPIEGKPFDRATAVDWAAAHCHDGISLLVATDHETFPEVIEISPPGIADPWWCIWQDPLGRYVVDNWHTWERSRLFAGMAAALDFIAGEIGTVKDSPWHPGLPEASGSARVSAHHGQ